ncbi:mitochondrial carrier domain-containing protein [Dichotomocladium elegans]|nr:mitochondrial carrier domain-containing protein [Dichotomocladium elegans]
MPADQSHPFATFPAAPGKGVNGLRPYYTPGLFNDNYTPVITNDTSTVTGNAGGPVVPYYANEHYDLIDSRAAARELVNFTVLKFITTAISCPFEVSKTLLQVQYMPHEDMEVVAGDSETRKQSSHDEDPYHEQHEGQGTNWFYEIMHLFLQPTLEGTLNDVFDLYDDTIPLVHLDRVGPNLATLVGSNLIVGFLLSPLELIRTRLIVQSRSPLHRKYKGPLDALRTILAEEGGLRGLYFNHNALPTVLYHTIVPLLQNITPLIIDRVFHISANDSPFLYSLAELGLNTLEILITLPLDTIRKRMQCQIRTRTPGRKRFSPVVALRPVPYRGVIDACYRIVKEEGGRRKKKQQQSRHMFTGWGLRGLYQGFGMQFTSNVVLFVMHAINGVDGKF